MNMLTNHQACMYAGKHGNDAVEYRANSSEPWAVCSSICAWNPAPFEYRVPARPLQVAKWSDLPRMSTVLLMCTELRVYGRVSELLEVDAACVWVLEKHTAQLIPKHECKLAAHQPEFIVPFGRPAYSSILHDAGFKVETNGSTFRIAGLREGWVME
jgi:hypothetical protein